VAQGEGRVAIITGSTTGIGRASAIGLAEAGFSVVIHDRSTDDRGVERELTARGLDVAFCAADLRQPAAAGRTLVDFALARYGRVDVVVNNAGVALHSPLRGITEENWNELLAVNLLAPFFLVQAAMDELIAHRGAVIMISSTNAETVNRDNIVYDTTKAALNQAARALALELRDQGVRVNTLMPGGTHTPLLDGWATEVTGGAEAAQRLLADGLARGNVAEPEQIAAGVVVLATGQADWINGATIAIDGGFRLGP
jgi:NAD(P)-dependent dehydrogenase (short-subunit alcohol dehydrogenase family)